VTCTNAVVDPVLGVLYCTARDPTLLDLPNSVFQLAQENQWTVIASSGDDGANENTRAFGSGELTPSFPATSPLVLSAGGTQGNPYGGQYGAPPYTSPLGCAPHTNCNVGLVTINGGEDGCGTAARPGTPTSCKPVGYGGEAAWNEFSTAVGGGAPGLSTGGGVSYLYSRPSYQSDLPGSFTTMFGQRIEANGRLNPDVSFNSAVFGGFLVWLGFLPAPRWGVFGGTSAASPAWAGIIALLNQAHNGPVGFINPAIYSMGAYYVGAERGPFHDITSGENSDTAGNFFGTYCFAAAPSPPPPQCTTYFDGWQAGPGYDLTTGWGTPNVSVFINAIQSFL
jgi:subtilase family serine protease